MADLNHPFWQCVRGEVEPPPCCTAVGWNVLEAEPDSGRIRIEFEAPVAWCNPLGQVQGGFLAGLLDFALMDALATTLEEGEFASTVELKANYIAPASPGKILGEGRVVHRGRSVAFVEGRLLAPDDTLIATASGTAKFIRPKSWTPGGGA